MIGILDFSELKYHKYSGSTIKKYTENDILYSYDQF